MSRSYTLTSEPSFLSFDLEQLLIFERVAFRKQNVLECQKIGKTVLECALWPNKNYLPFEFLIDFVPSLEDSF